MVVYLVAILALCVIAGTINAAVVRKVGWETNSIPWIATTFVLGSIVLAGIVYLVLSCLPEPNALSIFSPFCIAVAVCCCIFLVPYRNTYRKQLTKLTGWILVIYIYLCMYHWLGCSIRPPTLASANVYPAVEVGVKLTGATDVKVGNTTTVYARCWFKRYLLTNRNGIVYDSRDGFIAPEDAFAWSDAYLPRIDDLLLTLEGPHTVSPAHEQHPNADGIAKWTVQSESAGINQYFVSVKSGITEIRSVVRPDNELDDSLTLDISHDEILQEVVDGECFRRRLGT